MIQFILKKSKRTNAKTAGNRTNKAESQHDLKFNIQNQYSIYSNNQLEDTMKKNIHLQDYLNRDNT